MSFCFAVNVKYSLLLLSAPDASDFFICQVIYF